MFVKNYFFLQQMIEVENQSNGNINFLRKLYFIDNEKLN